MERARSPLAKIFRRGIRFSEQAVQERGSRSRKTPDEERSTNNFLRHLGMALPIIYELKTMT